jgi:transposase-like protein
MQISLRCKHCGFSFLNEQDSDLSLEIDFMEEEIRYVCRKCKRGNVIKLKGDAPKTGRLPGILVG